MKPLNYPEALRALISQLTRLPGIGGRGAERLALWLLQTGSSDANLLAHALQAAGEQVGYCPICGFFAEAGRHCSACDDVERDQHCICVVEQATDILPIERCGTYRGLYHCLGGKISPLDGIMPEDLCIGKLMSRVSERAGCEVILALSSDVEGEATGLYLAEQLGQLDCRVSRIAQGMPAGAGLGHTDAVTIMRALEGRASLK